jgi:hypothetical protein
MTASLIEPFSFQVPSSSMYHHPFTIEPVLGLQTPAAPAIMVKITPPWRGDNMQIEDFSRQ